MKRLLLLLALLCGPAAAQNTITVTAANTHQTWQATHSIFDTNSCVNLSAEQVWRITNYLVPMFNINAGQITHDSRGTLETTNDNTDPAVLVATPFNTAYTTVYAIGSCNFSTQTNARETDKALKFAAQLGLSVESNLRMFGYGSFTALPAHVKTGAGSIGTAEDEGREFVWGMSQQVFLDTGRWVKRASWNEPAIASGFFQAASTADWTGGWAKSLFDWSTAQGQVIRPSGPDLADAGTTVARLDDINLVAGAQASLGRVEHHCYPCPTGATATAIRDRGATMGVGTWLSEASPTLKETSSTFASGRHYVGSILMQQLNEVDIVAFGAVGQLAARCPNGAPCDDSDADPVAPILWTFDLSSFHITGFGHALYQLFHYALIPGYVRVDAVSNNANIQTTGWKRPDGTLVIVIANATGSSAAITISGLQNVLHDEFQADPTQCGTTGFLHCSVTSATATPVAGSLSVTVPTNGVWTISQRQTTFALRVMR